MSPTNDRRSFVSTLASLVGLTAIGASSGTAAAQPAAAPDDKWDLTWLDQLKGRHKQVYDLGSVDLAADPRVLRFARNFLDTFRDVCKLEFPDVNTAVGISGPAFAMNASDRLWTKYQLGERGKIIDPVTKKPAVRNIFFEDGNPSIKAMQARGTVFWQCNVALGNVAQQLAEANHLPPAEVRADLIAGLNPGVRLVPSHVMALALVQERGFTYMKP
jgi:intracellular sulfur oxidation DsrE/DsrF family protein